MAIMSSRMIRHEICKEEFKSIGGKVIDIQGIMFIVKFNINNNRISYAYHLNEDGSFFLERIRPYTLAIGDFKCEEDIVDVVKVDIEQFTNAMNSKNYMQFIEIDTHLSKLVRLFEDLYLYYNISPDDLTHLNTSVDGVLDQIKNIMSHSKRVYTKKDPDVLKEDVKF